MFLKAIKGFLVFLLAVILVTDVTLIVSSSTVKYRFFSYNFFEKQLDDGFYKESFKISSNVTSDILADNLDSLMNGTGQTKDDLKAEINSRLTPEIIEKEFEPNMKKGIRTIKTGIKPEYDLTGLSEISSEAVIKLKYPDGTSQSNITKTKVLVNDKLNAIDWNWINSPLSSLHKYYNLLNWIFFGSIALMFILLVFMLVMAGANWFLKTAGLSFIIAGGSIFGIIYYSSGMIPGVASNLLDVPNFAIQGLAPIVVRIISQILFFPQIMAGIIIGLGILFFVMSFFVKDV